MSINGIGAAGYPAAQYRTRKMERNAAGKNFAACAGETQKAAENASEWRAGYGIDYEERAFASVGAHAPEEVKRAWMDAAKESGVNGLGMSGNGMLTHISQMMAQRLTKQMNGTSETNDLLGNTVRSAIRAAQQALYDLEHPRSTGNVKSIEVQRQQVKERAFYQSFLEKLGGGIGVAEQQGNNWHQGGLENGH